MYVQPEDPTVKSEKTNRQKRVELRSEVKSSEIRRSSDIRSSDTKPREVINNSTPSIKKKPFQLTEVPSPVYGFSRPAKPSENIVEHELSHFLDDGTDKLLVSIMDTEKEPMHEVEIAAAETAVAISEIEVIEELPVNQPKVEEQTQDSSELQTRKRSHLPFNVMMLKQDKLKWEERKSRRTFACRNRE
jgi:S-DNA-T family DNA segregation ATPase FtsK/SpoIIIE